MKTIKLLWAFYLSAWFINATLLIVSIIFLKDLLVFNMSVLAVFVTYLHKENYRNLEYCFYYNNNVSKKELYMFFALLNLFFSLIISIWK